MKRLVSFSVATMLAMGMTAGAVCDKPVQQAGGTCKVSVQQAANAEQAFKQLCEKYGVSCTAAGKLGAASKKACAATGAKQGNCKLSAKPNGTNAGCKNTGKPSTGANAGTNAGKPSTDANAGTNAGKPSTDANAGTNAGKPSTDANAGTNAGKPSTDANAGTNAGKPSTDANTPSASQSSFAAQVVSLVNAERAKQGLAALKVDSRVTAAAQTRAGELKSSFAHTRPDGRSCFTALTEAGASYSGAGENIAYGQTSPQEVMTSWMNSAGHRANIMSNKYTTIGVGYTVIGGVAYWTQLFTY